MPPIEFNHRVVTLSPALLVASVSGSVHVTDLKYMVAGIEGLVSVWKQLAIVR